MILVYFIFLFERELILYKCMKREREREKNRILVYKINVESLVIKLINKYEES